jgi:hypothetical protein
MAGFSTALATKIFNATLNGAGRSNLTAYTNLYLSLHTAEPDDSNAPANEAAYTGYSRYNASTAFTTTTTETSNGEDTLVVSNTATMEFGASTSTNDTVVTHWALWDVSSGGTSANLMYSGALLDSAGDPTSRTIQEGDIPIFQAGQFKIKLI